MTDSDRERIDLEFAEKIKLIPSTPEVSDQHSIHSKMEKLACDSKQCIRPKDTKGVILVNMGHAVGAFPRMEPGQTMHLECYIDLCVVKAMKNNEVQ